MLIQKSFLGLSLVLATGFVGCGKSVTLLTPESEVIPKVSESKKSNNLNNPPPGSVPPAKEKEGLPNGESVAGVKPEPFTSSLTSAALQTQDGCPSEVTAKDTGIAPAVGEDLVIATVCDETRWSVRKSFIEKHQVEALTQKISRVVTQLSDTSKKELIQNRSVLRGCKSTNQKQDAASQVGVGIYENAFKKAALVSGPEHSGLAEIQSEDPKFQTFIFVDPANLDLVGVSRVIEGSQLTQAKVRWTVGSNRSEIEVRVFAIEELTRLTETSGLPKTHLFMKAKSFGNLFNHIEGNMDATCRSMTGLEIKTQNEMGRFLIP
jgi:hypothetical protein